MSHKHVEAFQSFLHENCKMGIMKLLPLLSLSFLILIACQEEEESKIEPLINSPAFTPYVERFLEAANSREANITGHLDKTLESLVIAFADKTTMRGHCGMAVSQRPPTILISSSCWQNISNDADREILIFHELGHAVLRRNHANAKLPNGDSKSIMHSGNQLGLYNANEREKRSYYLDELFNPRTPEPDWAKG